jgi:hypothetical protein
MLVEAQVSSMNTSFSARSSACPACQAARASVTSDRSCSWARDVFFSRQTKLQQATSDSRAAGLNALLGQMTTKIVDGHLRFGRHHGSNPIGMRRKHRRLVPTEGQRFNRLPIAPALQQLDHKADTDVKPFRRLKA